MRKAEMSIQLIISMMIILVLIAIMIFMVPNKMDFFTANVENCEAKGGFCTSSCEFTTTFSKDCSEGFVCCINNQGGVP